MGDRLRMGTRRDGFFSSLPDSLFEKPDRIVRVNKMVDPFPAEPEKRAVYGSGFAGSPPGPGDAGRRPVAGRAELVSGPDQHWPRHRLIRK